MLAALAGGTAAQAHEFKPAWGYAFIDDAPFNDPAAGGALLPSTRVFPRGYLRDTLVDGRDVRVSVFVFTPGKAGSQTSYSVDEGDFKNVDLSRRIDISPFEVSYLAYDFCRFNPSNGVVEVCEERHRIGRPADGGADAHRHADAGRGHAAARAGGRRRRRRARSRRLLGPERHRLPRGTGGSGQRDRRRLHRRRRAGPPHGHDPKRVDDGGAPRAPGRVADPRRAPRARSPRSPAAGRAARSSAARPRSTPRATPAC